MPFITLRDNAELYYKDWGNKTGPVVLFSHGWPLNADNWEAQMFFLANQGYRTIAHDRRGHGRSEQTWENNDIDSWADDLSELVEKLDLKDMTVVGHSTGGSELVRYCARHGTTRVKKMVLISANVPCLIKTDRTPNGIDVSILDGFRSAMEKDRAQFFRDVPTGPFFSFNRPHATISQGLIEAWFQQGMQAGFKASYDTTLSWHNYYGDDFKELDIPVLLLQGDDDQIVPIQTGVLEAIKLAKQGTLKVYPGGAHALPNLNAEEVNNDLLNFLKS